MGLLPISETFYLLTSGTPLSIFKKDRFHLHLYTQLVHTSLTDQCVEAKFSFLLLSSWSTVMNPECLVWEPKTATGKVLRWSHSINLFFKWNRRVVLSRSDTLLSDVCIFGPFILSCRWGSGRSAVWRTMIRNPGDRPRKPLPEQTSRSELCVYYSLNTILKFIY